MAKVKAKQGTAYDGKCFGAYVRQIAPNEHVKNGDVIVSSTSGKHIKVGGGDGSLKLREPEQKDNVMGCCE